MQSLCSLDRLSPGEKAKVRKVLSEGSIRRRFSDMGIIEDTLVECLGKSPMGDPSAYRIREAVIAIRKKDCRSILVERQDPV